jgi:hypothetical protein
VKIIFVILIFGVTANATVEKMLECSRRFTVALNVQNEAEVFGFLKYAGTLESSAQEYKSRLRPYFKTSGQEYIYYDDRYYKLVKKNNANDNQPANCALCPQYDVISCSVINLNCSFDLTGGMRLIVPAKAISADVLKEELSDYFKGSMGISRIKRISDKVNSQNDKILQREFAKLLDFCESAWGDFNPEISKQFNFTNPRAPASQ